jgi:hypothetical protein
MKFEGLKGKRLKEWEMVVSVKVTKKKKIKIEEKILFTWKTKLLYGLSRF